MVATMQQACVDGELMRNYTDVNDTKTLVNITNKSVGNITGYRCEPYDCNGNGRCVKGSCTCNTGMTNENETEAGFPEHLIDLLLCSAWKLLTFCEWLHTPSGVRMRLLYFICIGHWSVPNWIMARSFMVQRESRTSVCWIRSRIRHSASAWVHFEHRQPLAYMWKQTRCP